jgi:predicted transcriptional regulator
VSASATLRVEPGVKDRLDALAVARGLDPADLLAELVLQAETAQVVTEVNQELERLSQGPLDRRHERAQMRQLEATVLAWMRD